MSEPHGGDAPTEHYRRALESGRLAFQRCRGCHSAVFYPRVLCPVCGGDDLGWEESKGFGTVYATTTLYRRDERPYDVSLVDLEEGFRMMSWVEGINPEEVEIGLSVVLRVRSEDSGTVAVFEPEEKV